MDIKNIFDFENKVDFLLSDIKDVDIKLQGDFLNSDSISTSFNAIEEYMNDMYEKIRVLEEVIEYAQIYVNNEINETIEECRNLLNEIENLNDAIFNDVKNYTTINIPLINNDTSQYTDRDGSIIKTCEPYNGLISLSGIVKANIDIENVTVKSNEQCYSSNIDKFPGEAYRTHYLLDDINDNGIIETLEFNFLSPKCINSIKLKLSNCSIVDITYVYEDGTEKTSEELLKGIISERIISSVKVKIKSTNYEVKNIEPQTRVINFFEDIESSNTAINRYKNSFCEYLENTVKGES